MLTKEQIAHFYQQGYLIIPGIFSIAEITKTRELLSAAFEQQLWKQAPYSNASIINGIYTFFPQLVHTFINAPFITAIKDILGHDAVWIPECAMQRNRYIHWHRDTSIQELHGIHGHKEYKKTFDTGSYVSAG